jgi:hypothetical protein
LSLLKFPLRAGARLVRVGAGRVRVLTARVLGARNLEGVEAVYLRASAASRCGFGSNKMMRLLKAL